jgi:uncharacterized repeat protein (TIGR01451 family)
MRRSTPQKCLGFLRNLTATATIATVLALASANPAAAVTLGGTSAGATIHNVVQVDYKLSSAASAVQTIYSFVDVTVLTVPTTPTWYADTTKTVAGGAVATYSLNFLRSNANGPDTYTLTSGNGAAINADVQSAQSISAPTAPVIWGGITVQAAATSGGAVAPYSGILYFPGGSVNTTSLPIGSVLEVITSASAGLSKRYTVTGVNAGTPNNQAAGTASNEVFAQVTVTPNSGLAADQLGTATVAVGSQVGQVVAVTFQVTVGNPLIAGNVASNNTTLSAQGAATPATGGVAAAGTTSVTTNITSQVLLITKASRILTPAAAVNGTTNLTTASYSTAAGQQAKTGNVIEYLITVTNPNGNGAASTVTVKDPTPAYTTFKAGSQSIGTGAINAATVTGVTTVADVSAVWSGSGYTFSNLPGNTSLYIVYQVTVN